MEEFIKDKPLDSGPIYFFDQLKPKREKWEEETYEELFSHLMAKYGQKNRKSKELKEAELSAVTSSEKKDELQSTTISETLSVSKLPLNLKFSKTHWQKKLLEEYMFTAPEVLSELEMILQKYDEHNIMFPVGIINLMNYSWQDLIEGTFKCAPKYSMLSQHQALQGDSSSRTMVDSKEHKIRNDSKQEFNKENCPVEVKNGQHGTSFKSMKKICWIFQHPYSKLEILKWMTILSTAVERLQVAITQKKREEAKLKKEGFNKQLILSHYNEAEGAEKSQSTQGYQSFWLELLERRRPLMPIIKEVNPEMKKFHYALILIYPSGRLAVCQSYSNLPWGGVYTNIFSDLPDPVILGSFTPLGCGSISFPKRKIIAMMFNPHGGVVTDKTGKIVREWTWPLKGKLDDPVEIWVNKFITVKISGRFAITLFYKWHPQSVTLSLARLKCKAVSLCSPDMLFPDSNLVSREVWELLKVYKMKCKQQVLTTQSKDASDLADPGNMDTFDTTMDISPMLDIETAIQLRKLQRKVKHIFLHWLDHYRCALGMESLLPCKIPMFPQEVARKQKVILVNFPLRQDANNKNEDKEYLRYRNTFLMLKGFFNPSPLRRIQKTPARNQSSRLPLLTGSNDAWLTSQLICPVVLRRTLCGKEKDTCHCSCHSIPEVTDLEYDHLISNQLSSVDQIIIVYVFSAKGKDRIIKEVAKVYRELNRSRSMPCIQSRLDSFRLLKYNIISASKFTGSNCPLLVRRHNVIPGVFLMYIRGKLLFANFIFNGYSTSAKDLQEQIVKTRNDYHMGYFLPSDFRIRT